MPYQPANWGSLPNNLIEPYLPKPRESLGLGNLFKQVIEGYELAKKPGKLKREEQYENARNKVHIAEAEHAPAYYKNRAEAEAFKNMLEKKFGEREREAGLKEKEAHAKYWEQGGRSGGGAANSPKERRIQFNAMGPDGKAEMFRIGNAIGWTPQETIDNFISGKDFKEAAVEKGVDLETEQGAFLATGANRTRIKNMEGAAAELDVLEKKTGKSLAKYGGNKIFGYSPVQIMDTLQGKNKKEQVEFLVARALQPEIAGARSLLSGGSSAHAAIEEARHAALGNFKVFESLIPSEIYQDVQEGINRTLNEAFEARKDAIYGTKKGKRQAAEEFQKIAEEPDYGSLSEEELRILTGGS